MVWVQGRFHRHLRILSILNSNYTEMNVWIGRFEIFVLSGHRSTHFFPGCEPLEEGSAGSTATCFTWRGSIIASWTWVTEGDFTTTPILRSVLSKGITTNFGGLSIIVARGADIGPNTTEVSSSAEPMWEGIAHGESGRVKLTMIRKRACILNIYC